MESPYKPPETPVRDVPSQERGATWKAVLLGLLADVGGTIIFANLFALVIGIALGMQGRPMSDLQNLNTHNGFLTFSLFCGMAFTCLGGYVAARIANHAEYRHGFYLGIASLLTGILLQRVMDPAETPFWIDLLSHILIIPAALYGAHLRLRQKFAGG